MAPTATGERVTRSVGATPRNAQETLEPPSSKKAHHSRSIVMKPAKVFV
jgi:hypothetical protein